MLAGFFISSFFSSYTMHLEGNVKLTYKHNATEFLTPFILAFRRSNSFFERLLQRDCFRYVLKVAECSDQDKLSAFIVAIQNNRRDLLSLLLKCGVDIHAKSERVDMIEAVGTEKEHTITCNWAPLCFAFVRSNPKFIKWLCKKGACYNDLCSSSGFLPWIDKNLGAVERQSLLTIIDLPVKKQKNEEKMPLLNYR